MKTPVDTQVVPLSIEYSSVGSTGLTVTVPVVAPQLGCVVTLIVGWFGAGVAVFTVALALGADTQAGVAITLAITV